MSPSFTALPTEILEAIFFHLDPRSLVSASLTCKSVKKVAADSPVIWRHLCVSHFSHWASRHDIAAKLTGPLSDVDWRSLFIYRVNVERETRRLLDRVLETRLGRIKHINEIAEIGLDAKETLLRELQCPDDAEDVLARRYYANAILQRIQREIAINMWQRLSKNPDTPIELALGAFDVFVGTCDHVDFDTISSDLDRLAKRVLEQNPHFNEMSTRMKGTVLAGFLRQQGFQGVSEASYRALKNSFLGLTLRSPTHESLPLILAAIYCALARRLGVDCKPCGFLFHVYCIVYAPKDYTLDGAYRPSSSPDLDFMYLDPFRSSDEVHQHELKRVLWQFDVPSHEHSTFLTATDTRKMVQRTARNILTSVQEIHNRLTANGNAISIDINGVLFPDMEDALYSAVWAHVITWSTDTMREYLQYLVDLLHLHFPWDVPILEKCIIPAARGRPEASSLIQFAQTMHAVDSTENHVHHRTPDTAHVRYRVGQPFKHKRYGYEGVVTGWDPLCDAGEDWIRNMGVDRLPYGRNQSFYHVW